MYCHSCGNEQSANVNFCKRCGARINQPQTDNHQEPVNVDISRPFRSIGTLGIVGIAILTFMYLRLYKSGARDIELVFPFIVGAGLLAIIAIVMGLLFNRALGHQIREQKNQPKKSPTQATDRSTGQIALPPQDESYSPVGSVVDEPTRKIQQ